MRCFCIQAEFREGGHGNAILNGYSILCAPSNMSPREIPFGSGRCPKVFSFREMTEETVEEKILKLLDEVFDPKRP